jgi:hypothetical protein
MCFLLMKELDGYDVMGSPLAWEGHGIKQVYIRGKCVFDCARVWDGLRYI